MHFSGSLYSMDYILRKYTAADKIRSTALNLMQKNFSQQILDIEVQTKFMKLKCFLRSGPSIEP